MNTAIDPAIEAFRQTLDRLDSITSHLRTVAINILRADELPGLIQRSGDGLEARWLREEQTAIGHPVRLRILRSQLDNELRQVHSMVGEQMRAAIDAATQRVTDAAGGPGAVGAFLFVRWHLAELARHRHPPSTVNTSAWLAFIQSAWQEIDFAMAALHEIRYHARQRNSSS